MKVFTVPIFTVSILTVLLLTAGILLGGPSMAGAQPLPWTLEVELAGARIQGTPLGWTEREVQLLGRDGRLWTFSPNQVQTFRKTASTFRSSSQAEVRSSLLFQFGRSFEVSGTGHYLVVHPAGQADYWSPRFEELYRAFVRYFGVRGLPLREPEFPLVAVVFGRQEDFLRHAAADGLRLPAAVCGYYSQTTNRICLFDAGGGKATAGDWQRNSETIVHEAAHQTAFNTGVHARFAETPQWVVEGLGTLFEAPGVWDSQTRNRLEDRLLPGRRADFNRYLKARPGGGLADFVSSDRPFQTDPLGAYGQAWALTLFLTESRPALYGEYLKRLAIRPAFRPYPSADRLSDFQAAFGRDLRLLNAHFLRFIAELP